MKHSWQLAEERIRLAEISDPNCKTLTTFVLEAYLTFLIGSKVVVNQSMWNFVKETT